MMINEPHQCLGLFEQVPEFIGKLGTLNRDIVEIGEIDEGLALRVDLRASQING